MHDKVWQECYNNQTFTISIVLFSFLSWENLIRFLGAEPQREDQLWNTAGHQGNCFFFFICFCKFKPHFSEVIETWTKTHMSVTSSPTFRMLWPLTSDKLEEHYFRMFAKILSFLKKSKPVNVGGLRFYTDTALII